MSPAVAIPDSVQRQLADSGQTDVLRYWSTLDPLAQRALLSDLASVEFRGLADSIRDYVTQRPKVAIPADIVPAEILPAAPDTPQRKKLYDDARAAGEAAIRAGQVAAFTVAGGQGTRLGYDGPKGAFRITPIRNAPLFQWFAEYLHGVRRRYGVVVPWFLMTSPQNDAPTQSFFRDHQHFGLPAESIHFFMQGQMPAFHPDGRIALAERGRLALSPDGHGGSLRALRASGALERMSRGGVKYISYFQVDNPLVHCIDPLFIGLHALTGSEMSSKAVRKAADRERVGNFCIGDGKLQIIEYSDLPNELADAKNADGSRRFDAGSIAIHILDRAFVERLTDPNATLRLPWHRADKAVPVLDDAGNLVKPTAPNVVKLEMFVFDAIPLAKNPLVMFTDRGEEFSPVKNAEGSDSPATTRRDLCRRAAAWLRGCGVTLPVGADGSPTHPIEISPQYALDARDLADRLRVERPSLRTDGPLLLT